MKLEKIGMFAEMTPEELMDTINSMEPSERALASLIYGLTWNTACMVANDEV